MIDLDQFEERAAIMEYDGGLSRFRAETLAAQAQGRQRKEVLDEIGKRNSARPSDHGEAVARHGQDALPRVQPRPEEQKGSLSQRDVQA